MMTNSTMPSLHDEPARRRRLLEEVLLTAGVTYPLASPERWAEFLRGEFDLDLDDLELDSLSLNELSVSLELRAGLRLTPAELAEFTTLSDISDRLDLPPLRGVAMQHDESPETPAESAAPGRAALTFRGHRTVGEFAREVIRDIIASSTPRRLVAVARSPLGGLPRFNDARKFAAMLPTVGGAHAGWSRRSLAADVLLFRSDERVPGATPIVIFGGNARRPMMPMALFLTAVAGISDTVVLVRTRKNDAFRSGITGVGKGMERSFTTLAGILKRRLDLTHPDRTPLIIGTSGGGLPALIFSEDLECRRVVMVGPNATDDPRWEGSPALVRVLDRQQNSATRPHVVVCYETEGRDVSKVSAWRRDLPAAQLLAVPGAGHNALFALYKRNELADQLRSWTE